mmetsp:Transcript_38023/g.43671  ORF Transcript_38023/g.43671 Transcript_38023/m.43671 type:complete len:111 (+) Transcript_38023:99-431(+)
MTRTRSSSARSTSSSRPSKATRTLQRSATASERTGRKRRSRPKAGRKSSSPQKTRRSLLGTNKTVPTDPGQNFGNIVQCPSKEDEKEENDKEEEKTALGFDEFIDVIKES